jgi:hypothetical protein
MRLKIIAGNLIVVLLSGLIAYFTVRNGISGDLGRDVDTSIGNDQILLDRSFQLAALNFVTNVTERAQDRQMNDVFDGLDDNARRMRAFNAAEATYKWLADPARGSRGTPDIVVITDETGRVLARNGAPNVSAGKALLPSLPALAEVLKDGVSKHDVWLEDNEKKLLQTALAPIRDEETKNVIGALIAGYDLSDGVAKEQGRLIGCDVAFVSKDKVYSSSLEGGSAQGLSGYLFGGAGTASKDAILSGSNYRSEPWNTNISGNSYIGITARLPMSNSLPVAYAVLGNRTAHMAPASRTNVIMYLFILSSILVIVYGFAVGGSLMRQIERVEEGVLAVINGRTDIRLETDSPELGGLAYRINQLINILTGTEEESEDAEGRVSAAPKNDAWKDAEFSNGSGGGGGAAEPAPVSSSGESAGAGAPASGGAAEEVIDDPKIATKLGDEDEAAYSARVYSEYVAAKQKLGENVSNITQDRFMQRLKGRAEALAKQHGCRLVRFQVQTRDNQVALRPVLIR